MSGDVDCVVVPTLQVVPGARGGVCGADVRVPVSHCEGDVVLSSIGRSPADGALVVLALNVALHV